MDKLTWQVIRIHVATPGAVTAFPSYDAIATYTNIKSNHTVARALAILRATRWLSLCACVRNSNGRYLGNIYVLHDEPITLGDAIYLDSDYMRFLQSSSEHSHPRVRKIAQSVLETIQTLIDNGRDPMGERIHTHAYERRISTTRHLQQGDGPTLLISERSNLFAISDPLIKQLANSEEEHPSAMQKLHTVGGEPDHVQIMHTGVTENSDPVQKLHMAENTENHPVQKLHTATRSSSNNKITTTTTGSNTPRARVIIPSCTSHPTSRSTNAISP